jgi:PAS domain S-box-containing protein
VQASPAVIYTAKASGDFGAMFVSANITSLTGYAPSEFVENSGFWVSRTHPDDLPRVMAELERLPERGEVLTEYRFRYKDGSYHWVQDGCRLTRDAHGAPEAVVGYWLDITERKQAEEALWGSERQLRAVLDGMPLMGVILDRAGVVTMCNDSLLALTGWERGDVLNRNWFTLFLPSEIRDQVHGLFLEAVDSGGTPDRFENEIVTRTGARRLI